jgi:hypothetical protein
VQFEAVPSHELTSPVIKPATIQLLLALAVHFDWSIKQLDISNAFLHSFLDEDVYIEQPQGFVDRHFPTYVCKLHKAFYGLKQAPRAWFTLLSLTLYLNLAFLALKLILHYLFIILKVLTFSS